MDDVFEERKHLLEVMVNRKWGCVRFDDTTEYVYERNEIEKW